MRYILAGDRDIAVWILEFLVNQGFWPLALVLSDEHKASHNNDLIALSQMPAERILYGNSINDTDKIKELKELQPDYIFGVHFPYIIKRDALSIPKIGFLNLHPAYLPFNKGWHTPSWAIINQTPMGATLHYMTEKLDNGDIIHQKAIVVEPSDTAHSLYEKTKKLEFEVFQEAFPCLIKLTPPRKPQNNDNSTSHRKNDLFKKEVQQIHLDKSYEAQTLIDRLRALTTNNLKEAAYFVQNGIKYRIQVEITKDTDD